MYKVGSNLLFQNSDFNNNNNRSESFTFAGNTSSQIQWPKFNLPVDFGKRFHIKVVSGIIVEDHEFPYMVSNKRI